MISYMMAVVTFALYVTSYHKFAIIAIYEKIRNQNVHDFDLDLGQGYM